MYMLIKHAVRPRKKRVQLHGMTSQEGKGLHDFCKALAASLREFLENGFSHQLQLPGLVLHTEPETNKRLIGTFLT